MERIAQLCSDVDHERLEQELAMLAQRFTLHLEPGARLSAEAMISLRPRGGIRMTLHSTHENPERRRAVG